MRRLSLTSPMGAVASSASTRAWKPALAGKAPAGWAIPPASRNTPAVASALRAVRGTARRETERVMSVVTFHVAANAHREAGQTHLLRALAADAVGMNRTRKR